MKSPPLFASSRERANFFFLFQADVHICRELSLAKERPFVGQKTRNDGRTIFGFIRQWAGTTGGSPSSLVVI